MTMACANAMHAGAKIPTRTGTDAADERRRQMVEALVPALGGTRTHNLLLRRETPCPLGHKGADWPRRLGPARDSNPESSVPKTDAVSIGPTGLIATRSWSHDATKACGCSCSCPRPHLGSRTAEEQGGSIMRSCGLAFDRWALVVSLGKK